MFITNSFLFASQDLVDELILIYFKDHEEALTD